ncbi:carbamoyltransferase HypF [Desulfococcaceae bacterium HSG8]|nr:carbamoyltransferase HypF [Desulfococcaceae bacterium HSG8]
MTENNIAKRLEINGIVQGVGFRPFVYQLANQYDLKGKIANTSSGVSVHLEGTEEKIQSFCADITKKAPPLAHIVEISVHPENVRKFKDFSITESKSQAKRSTLISPDVSVCEDCLRELFDSQDRRYHYPFINCTNCGPRYTIIADIPYDRPETSMKHFKMCEKCQAEYDDPENRRFHAQPNACEACGPHATLYDNTRKGIQADDPIEKTAALLKQGYILAIKGLGGFHLAADAENDEAVFRLRQRKQREEKPFALMSYDIDQIRRYACVKPEDEALLLSHQRPIVLLEKKEPNSLSAGVSPRNKYFGVMLPYTPLHYLLLKYLSRSDSQTTALVMTSGNMSDEPIAIENDDAFNRLPEIADYFLIHNRDIYLRSDDSIVRSLKLETGNWRLETGDWRLETGDWRLETGNWKLETGNWKLETQFIRRSRGYVPVPVFLKRKIPQILACGAALKNTVCLTRENKAFLSQHIGDLENFATYEFFKLTIEHMKRILDINPEIIAHDLHPDYLSTCYAKEQQGIKKIPVQHHHAHIVSCMAEHKLEGPVIGLSFDGTGYGTDGNIWGGEVFIAETDRFVRTAHLAYVPMPGGASAIKEPWRMAVSYLYDAFGEEFLNLDLPMLRKTDENKIKIILEMIKKNINAPYTSSMGRFFDGIAGIIGIRDKVFFEGQAAMELEMIAEEKKETGCYKYELISGDISHIPLQSIVRGIVKDIEKNIHPREISIKFHATLISLFSNLCEVKRRENGLNRIVLSGGVFQNAILLTGLMKKLEDKNFHVFTHNRIPPNDGGISLGQAAISAALAK